MAVSTWDFSKLVVSWSGVVITGFAEAVTISPDGGDDTAKKTVGSDGRETVVVYTNDTSGSVTMSLMASAVTNSTLSALAAAKTIGPLLIKDLNGTTVLQATAAWVAKRPETVFGKELSPREWRIDYADGNLVIGGLTPV